MLNKIVLSAVASLALIGCSEQLDEEDSRVAFTAAFSTLSAGGAAAQTSAATPVQADETPVFRAGAAGSVDYDYACPGGGTAHFAGSVTAVSDDVGGQASFTFATDFAGCKTLLDVTIDGSLDYASSVSGSAESATVTLSMDGSLSFSGKVDGTCDIEVDLSVSAAPGSAMGTYSGSVCGHDASATLNVQG